MTMLETPRLILRPMTAGDAEDLYEYARDPRVGPDAGWSIHKSLEESREIIASVFSAPNTFGLVLKESGKMIGSAGLVDRHYDLLPGPDDEIGYALNPACWGRGLAPEAVRELLRCGFEDLGLETIWCGHYDFNARSRRVVEKCGVRYRFTEQADVPLLGERRTELHYALTRAEWAAAAPTPAGEIDRMRRYAFP